MEETASISESDEESDEDQLELTPRQLSHLIPLIKEGTLKQNSTQREDESEKKDILIRNREIDFNVTHLSKIQHSNKKTSMPDITGPHNRSKSDTYSTQNTSQNTLQIHPSHPKNIH